MSRGPVLTLYTASKVPPSEGTRAAYPCRSGRLTGRPGLMSLCIAVTSGAHGSRLAQSIWIFGLGKRLALAVQETPPHEPAQCDQ